MNTHSHTLTQEQAEIINKDIDDIFPSYLDTVVYFQRVLVFEITQPMGKK